MDPEQAMDNELRDAQRAIPAHPGYQEHLKLQALERSIADVFIPNRDLLLSLLEGASTRWELAFELIQNVRTPLVRDRFYSMLTRYLHNYLASAASLRDHVRYLMDGREGPITEEFERRKREVLKHPEVPFVFDLRNFALHRKVPFFAHTLSMTNVNKPDQKMESEVQLNVVELLEWEGWSSAAEAYLRGLGEGEAVSLRPVMRLHADLVLGLNVWLLRELGEANAGSLDEVNELVVAGNAILAGGDMEEARRMAHRYDPPQ
jgi:hypothetical protein